MKIIVSLRVPTDILRSSAYCCEINPRYIFPYCVCEIPGDLQEAVREYSFHLCVPACLRIYFDACLWISMYFSAYL